MILLLSVATGFLVLRLAWPNALRICRHDILRLSLGVGIGLALASIVTFTVDALLAGNRRLVAAADVALFLTTLAAYVALRRETPCVFCVREPSSAGLVVWAAAGVALLSAGLSFSLFTKANPYGEWDAWAIWNHHARFLASGPHWKQMFLPPLVWAVQDYPLLTPGAIANAWMVSGSESTSVPALVAALFLFGAAGTVFGALDLLRGRTQALIAVTTLFGASAVIHKAASQYADVPLAFFFVATVALINIPDAFPADRHSLWLAGTSAGCAAWTKNEGLVFLAVVLVSRSLSKEWKRLPMMIAGTLPLLAVVLWFKTAYAPANYLFSEQQPLATRLGDISRYITVAVEFGKQLFAFGGWIVPPVLIAAGYLWLLKTSKDGGSGRTAAVIALSLMTLAYAGVYVFTTKDLNWQIENSLSRVLLQLWPMAVLVFFLYANEPREHSATERKPAKRGKQKGVRA